MNLTGAEITGQQITFCALEISGEPIQHLSFIPIGFIDYHGQSTGDYVMVKIHLAVGDNNSSTVDDHMTVGSFTRLYDLLFGFQNGLAGSETFGTADGQLELTVEWREAMRDVRFSGRIPSFDFTELHHNEDRYHE
jgi:hypothetical protein